ncbi:claspin isoform X2 [Nematostella vectensis]|uniref:claspin isoform X2 n=1 Tax=Nematostella vectensis TaxID=45351 RepID=UPI00138FE9C3|nr:claspin isoform X2 [Nematostella vectensis]
MASAVDVLQSFASNNDLFDAEIGEESNGAENGVPSDTEEKPLSSTSEHDSNEENEAPANEGSDSEDKDKDEFGGSNTKAKRGNRSPKPRKMKKAAIQLIHSESQRMVRESLLKLPYHQPEAKPISHFLKRVPIIKDEPIKKSNNKKASQENQSVVDGDKDNEEISATPLTVINTEAKNITPKLSTEDDPFFFEETPTSKPPNKGIQSLMERFMKHATKPSPKIKKAEKTVEEAKSPVAALIPEDNIDKSTPGARLKILKAQLESKMKQQRAKLRQIHESQRKLDDEEMSEEEEEEDITESDSDGELDKWNEIDERRQEEGINFNDDVKTSKSEFVDDEAEDDADDDDDYDYLVDHASGSDGDVSDEGNCDGEDARGSHKMSKNKIKKLKKSFKSISNTKLVIQNNDEQTIDLFNDSSSSSKLFNMEGARSSKHHSEESEGLCLRLDSIEDEEEEEEELTKLKEFKTPAPVSSTETSQSSLAITSDADGSNESSRIQAAQGGGHMMRESDTTSELSSLFPHFADRVSDSSRTHGTLKTPGKLSQLTLPIEDSQDLFEKNDEKQPTSATGASQSDGANDFHFSLDEDTQFTQMLDTQGFLYSSKKPKKPKTLFVFEDTNKDDDAMDEILGLCSGKFGGDGAISQAPRPTQDPNMDEIIGLCSGQFSDSLPQGSWSKKGFNFSGSQSSYSKSLQVEGEESKEKADDNDKPENDNEDVGSKEYLDEIQDDDIDDIDDKSGDEELISKQGKTKKVFDKMNFLEEEAELSGSDVGSDEDEDINTDDDELEEDSDQEELPSDHELQKQINKVHMKTMMDQDKAELRLMKEMYLQDGDLFTDGEGRKRNFRWRGIDQNSQLDLFDKRLWGDEDGVNVELLTEEESKRRKERFERDTFLREELKKGRNENMIHDTDENSQSILNIIKDTSSTTAAATVTPKAQQQPSRHLKVSSCPKLQRIPSQKGSFLNRSKATLNRLSSITANTPNASSSGRTFVFQAVSDKDKAESNPKKMPRTVSMIEPAAKRPKLDRSLSDAAKGSIFAML